MVGGAAYCWGDNSYGKLGNNSTEQSTIPVPVFGLTARVTSVSASPFSSCAVVGGAAYCWGDNSYGKLGNNSTEQSSVPVPVFGLTAGATSVAAGSDHSCAVVNGAAYCWGVNYFGALGNGSQTNSPVAVQVTGLTAYVGSVTAGQFHSCALGATINGGRALQGAVFCWGGNSYGQLGGNSTAAGTPVRVSVGGLSGDHPAIPASVAAGSTFSCAIFDGVSGGNGTTYGPAALCWGNNTNSQLGNNSTVNSSVPVQVTGLTRGVTSVAAGNAHGCAVVNGAAYCWGDNSYGQLGNATTTPSSVPVQVAGLLGGVTAVTTGVRHSCAIVNGSAYCWGSNSSGQLGNNSTTDSLVLVQVHFQ